MEHYQTLEILDRISSHYTGHQAINRYHALAESSPSLSLISYKKAVEAVIRDTWEITTYDILIASHNKIAGSPNNQQHSQIEPDQQWLEATQAEIEHDFLRIDNEIKTYTTELVRDGIWISYRDMASHYRKTGDQNNALKYLLKAREYCGTPYQLAQVLLAVIDLGFDTLDFKMVEGYIAQVERVLEALAPEIESKGAKSKADPVNLGGSFFNQDSYEKELQGWNERMKVVAGLCALGQGDYFQAIQSFLQITRQAGQNPDMETLASSPDIVLYITLCCLACLDRKQIKQNVLDNAELQSLLEVEPHLRTILSLSRENRYKDVLQFIENSTPAFRADIYLSGHIDNLVGMIHDKAIIQYLTPFSKITFEKAADAFSWTTERLEKQLIELIQVKQTLKGKLDLNFGIYHRSESNLKNEDQIRTQLLTDLLDSSQRIELETKAGIYRLKLLHEDVIVKEPCNNLKSNN